MPPRLAVLFGPTGCGKTALACALADRLPLHLISCDAVQVFRALRAATAKPAGDEWRHGWAMVDVVEPSVDVDLGAFVRAMEAEVAWATRCGRWPLVVGGTGLYLRGLLKGVARGPERDEALRARLRALHARRGEGFLHRVLTRLDAPAAAKIGVRDLQRLVRALEIRLSTGQRASSLAGEAFASADRYATLRLHLDLERAVLDQRIDVRVERFLEGGLVAEVRALLASGLDPECNALKAIGYRETVTALAAEGPLDEAALIHAIRRSTRRFARKQVTWFRRETPSLALDAGEPRSALDAAEEALRRHFAPTSL